jgi:hypothetical protein
VASMTRSESGQHATHIGVQYDLPPPVREAGDSRRRVGAHSGQPSQRLAVCGHPATEVVGDHLSCLMQAQCSSRVSQPPPGSYCLTRRGGRQRFGRRPALHPGLPRASYPLHWRLLQHELADHDRPRCRAGPAPWQIARVLGVPANDPPHHRLRSAGRQESIRDAMRHKRQATLSDCVGLHAPLGGVPPAGPETGSLGSAL